LSTVERVLTETPSFCSSISTAVSSYSI
jgi:hypothetical protein